MSLSLLKNKLIIGNFVDIIEFEEDGTLISGFVSGLGTKKHGFHVHEFGDLSDGCKSCGGHFNPYGVSFRNTLMTQITV